MNHCLQATKRKDADGNAGGHMSPEKKQNNFLEN